MSEGSHFTPEVRQRAVDAVLDGMSIANVTVAYGVDQKLFRDGSQSFVLAALMHCSAKSEAVVYES